MENLILKVWSEDLECDFEDVIGDEKSSNPVMLITLERKEWEHRDVLAHLRDEGQSVFQFESREQRNY